MSDQEFKVHSAPGQDGKYQCFSEHTQMYVGDVYDTKEEADEMCRLLNEVDSDSTWDDAEPPPKG